MASLQNASNSRVRRSTTASTTPGAWSASSLSRIRRGLPTLQRLRTPAARKTRKKRDGSVINNDANYWGHPHIPLRNPQTDMLIDTAINGKKSK